LATAIYQSRRIRFSEVRIFISLFEKLWGEFLVRFLNEVRDTVQEIKKEGRISGMIRARTNAIQIKALKQSMNNRVSCFKVILFYPLITF
jgi:hypothetical protein